MRRFAPFGLGLVLFLLLGFEVFPRVLQPSVRQPIAFNHKKHADNGLECVACHEFVNKERFAGIPPIATCLACHEESITTSPEEKKIQLFAAESKEIPWVRLFKQAGHVHFSHMRHVTIGKIGCSACHGEVGMNSAPPSSLPHQLTMDDCISCHKKAEALNDCTGCHK